MSAQDTSGVGKRFLPHVKVNNELFDNIFGQYCLDTLTNPKDKETIYVLEKKSDHNSYVTAYKKGKKKWSVYVNNFFGGTPVEIKCFDLYDIDNILRIRVFNNAPHNLNKKVYYVDLSLANGTLIEKKILIAPQDLTGTYVLVQSVKHLFCTLEIKENGEVTQTCNDDETKEISILKGRWYLKKDTLIVQYPGKNTPVVKFIPRQNCLLDPARINCVFKKKN